MDAIGFPHSDSKAEAGQGLAIQGNFRILILDADAGDTRRIESELRSKGIAFESRQVDSEQSYRESLADFRPDLILSESDLPRFSGLHALKLALEARPEVPFILVTKAVREERAIEFVTGGAADYVLKERLSRLAPAVRRALDEAGRRKALKKAAQVQERLTLALLCAAEGAWDWDLKNNVLVWDQRCREIFGLPPEVEVNFESFLRLLHPEDQPRIRESAWAALKNREEFNQEFRIPKPGGAWGWVASRGSGYYGDSGEADRMLGTFSDITGERQTRQKLSIALQQLNALMANSPLAVLQVDRQFRIIRWSGAAESLFGWGAAEAVGRTFDELRLIHEADAERVKTLFLNMVAGHQPRNVHSNRNYCRDGKVLYCEWYNSAVYSESGGLISILSLGLDMTEYRNAEEGLKERGQQLKEANRELESFNYMVSHDLRAPLRTIMGFSAMLTADQGKGLSPKQKKTAGIIRENVQKMDRMIESLLTFSRYSRRSLHKAVIDMEALLQEVLNDFGSEIEGRKIKIIRERKLPVALGDRDLIRQVWTNLLSNAIKFTSRREQGVIEVVGEEQTPENRFCVKDNGIGFDMQYSERLFGVFQRLHPAGEYEGTGLGLAIVQRIIHKHGGRIWADAAVGRGATFCFTLPSR